MRSTFPKIERRTLKDLLPGLPQQLVPDIFSFVPAKLDTRTLIHRATRDLKPYTKNSIRDQDASDNEGGAADGPALSAQPNRYARHVRSFVPQNAERFDALLAAVGTMASLRGVSTAFRDIVDEMAAREHLAEFGVLHVETTVPVGHVEDYALLKLDPQARNAVRPRRGAPWAALADRVRAVVALMTSVLAEDFCARERLSKSLHGKYIKWRTRQKDTLARAFMKTGWTTPWVIDANYIRIEKCGKEFDTDDPRCVALHAFAVSLAPPSSAGKIYDLPSGRTRSAERVVLFDGMGIRNPLVVETGSRNLASTHILTSFCAFSFRPNDDDFTTQVDDESGDVLHPRRGGYAVRVADLREPEGGSVESVRRWEQFWAEEEDSDRDYDDDFDSDRESSYVDYASFENPFADGPPPIVLDTVRFYFSEVFRSRAQVVLRFRFADCSTCDAPCGLELIVEGQIQLQTGGLCFSRPDSDDEGH